jgi:di/tricarboxylate transporter
MDPTSVLTFVYIGGFVLYMNITSSSDKVSPILTLATLTLATVSYHQETDLKEIIQSSMSTIFVSLFLVSLISRVLSQGTIFRKLVSCFSWIPSQWMFRIFILMFSLLFSGFINNAMIVSITIPLVQKICRKKNWNSSSYLLPISFASMMGGTTTLIGSSTNLIAYELLQPKMDISMFSMFQYSFLTGLIGVIYLSIASFICLANRDPIYLETFMYRLPANSSYHGQTLQSTPLQDLDNQLCAIVRDHHFMTMPVQSNQTILEKDQLVYISTGTSTTHKLGQLETGANLELVDDTILDTLEIPIYIYRATCSREVAGKLCTHVGFKKKYGLVVLAVIRNDSIIRNYLSNIVFEEGDEMIVASTSETITGEEHPLFQTVERLYSGMKHQDTDKYAIDGEINRDGYTVFVREALAWIVVFLFIANGVGAWFTYPWASLVLILGWYALEMVASRIGYPNIGATKNDIRIVWKGQISVFLITYASLLFTESVAKTSFFIEISGQLGERLGQVSSDLGHFGYFWGDKSVLFCLICILTHLLVSSMSLIFSNAATVSLFLNILLEIYKKDSLNNPLFQSLAFVIIHGGSSCFASPIGYHTNVMVSQYSNYRCRDFMTLGLPLHLINSVLFGFLVAVI